MYSSQSCNLGHVLYSPERLSKIATEAVKEQSIFSLNDRISFVHDIIALSKSGHSSVSSALTLTDMLRNEKECKTLSVDSFDLKLH
jgi:aminopeptidase 2